MSLLLMMLSNLFIRNPEIESLRILQGTRFTGLDLDPVTARRWVETMTAWAGEP